MQPEAYMLNILCCFFFFLLQDRKEGLAVLIIKFPLQIEMSGLQTSFLYLGWESFY